MKPLWPSLGDYVIGNNSYLCVVFWSHEDNPENKDKEHHQEQFPSWSIWKQSEQCPRNEDTSHHTLNKDWPGCLWELSLLLLSYYQSGFTLSWDFTKSSLEIKEGVFPWGKEPNRWRDCTLLTRDRSGAMWNRSGSFAPFQIRSAIIYTQNLLSWHSFILMLIWWVSFSQGQQQIDLSFQFKDVQLLRQLPSTSNFIFILY